MSKQYYKYLIVAIIFIVAFIIGRNMDESTPEQKMLQNQIYLQQKAASGTYIFPADQEQFSPNQNFSIKRGQCGRLFFDLKRISKSIDEFSGKAELKVLFANDLGETSDIASPELANSGFIQHKEIDFCANSDYQNLIFKKSKTGFTDYLQISEIQYYPLAIAKSDFSHTATPILGNTNFSVVISEPAMLSPVANRAYSFSRKNQIIGQRFLAGSDMLSGVDMKLDFKGVGGVGNYLLVLKKVDVKGGRLQPADEDIAYTYFNQDMADKEYKTAPGIYHIPIAAKLNKGETYLVGISNKSVKFNPLNTLKVFGGEADNDGKVVNIVGQKTRETKGNLYIKAYGADYVAAQGQKVLSGAMVLDDGDGTGHYAYKQNGDISDYLDLDQASTIANDSTWFDNTQAGVVAKCESNLVYKLNLFNSFQRMEIEAEQLGGEYSDSLLYYSFDNINWSEITNGMSQNDDLSSLNKNRFSTTLTGDGKARSVYIKAICNNLDDQTKTIHKFGLKNLSVFASLKMGQK